MTRVQFFSDQNLNTVLCNGVIDYLLRFIRHPFITYISIQATVLEVVANQHISNGGEDKIDVVGMCSTCEMAVNILVWIFVLIHKSFLNGKKVHILLSKKFHFPILTLNADLYNKLTNGQFKKDKTKKKQTNTEHMTRNLNVIGSLFIIVRIPIKIRKCFFDGGRPAFFQFFHENITFVEKNNHRSSDKPSIVANGAEQT